MRRAAKIDANQPGIVKALERVGVSVESIGKPVDLLWHNPHACCPHCGERLPDGKTGVLEVKNPDGKDMITKEQAEFMSRWSGPVPVARTEEEAIREVLGEKVLA